MADMSAQDSLKKVTEIDNSSTQLLVPYSDSDSDTEADEVVEIKQDRRSVSSYDSESDSDSSSSESSSSSSTESSESESSTGTDSDALQAKDGDSLEINVIKVLSKNPAKKNVKAKTRSELGLEDLPPIEDLHITVPKAEVQQIGHVLSIVECLVTIETLVGLPALNLDTMLFFENGDTFGKVFDVFGPVPKPMYIVRFNSNKEIQDKGISAKLPVYFAPKKQEFTKFVFTDQLRRMKGCDASWKDDNEPPDNKVEYSDDEEERVAKGRSKKKNLQRNQEQHSLNVQPRTMNSRYRPCQPRGFNNNYHAGPRPGGNYCRPPRPPFIRQPIYSNPGQIASNQPVQWEFPQTAPYMNYAPQPRFTVVAPPPSPPMLLTQYNWTPNFFPYHQQQVNTEYPNPTAYAGPNNFGPGLLPPTTPNADLNQQATIAVASSESIPFDAGSILPNPFRETAPVISSSASHVNGAGSSSSLYTVSTLEASAVPMFPPSGFVTHSST